MITSAKDPFNFDADLDPGPGIFFLRFTEFFNKNNFQIFCFIFFDFYPKTSLS